jgi:hypothetical protein
LENTDTEFWLPMFLSLEYWCEEIHLKKVTESESTQPQILKSIVESPSPIRKNKKEIRKSKKS